MFKLSVITDEVSQDLRIVASFAKKFNVEGIEIRSLGENPQNLLEEVDNIKKILSEYGLKVSAIASPFFKSDMMTRRNMKNT